MVKTALCSLHDCSVVFGDFTALEGVTLEVFKGDVLYIRGDNGSGKTVLINALLGLVPVSCGKHCLSFDSSSVCYIPTTPLFYDREFVIEYLHLLTLLYKESYDTFVSIAALIDLNLNVIRFKHFDELSAGIRQKLNILPLFIPNQKFYILDEVLTNLDQKTRTVIADFIAHSLPKDATLIFTEHSTSLNASVKSSRNNMKEYLCKNGTLKLISSL